MGVSSSNSTPAAHVETVKQEGSNGVDKHHSGDSQEKEKTAAVQNESQSNVSHSALPTRRARRIQGTERRDPRTRIAAKTWPTNAKTRSKGVERSAQRTEEMIETSVDIPLSSNVKMNGPNAMGPISMVVLLLNLQIQIENRNAGRRIQL